MAASPDANDEHAGSAVSTAMAKSPFAKLSAELRNQIYELVYTNKDDVVVYHPDGRRSKLPGLAFTCHQIQDESEKLFYSLNTFVFYTDLLDEDTDLLDERTADGRYQAVTIQEQCASYLDLFERWAKPRAQRLKHAKSIVIDLDTFGWNDTLFPEIKNALLVPVMASMATEVWQRITVRVEFAPFVDVDRYATLSLKSPIAAFQRRCTEKIEAKVSYLYKQNKPSLMIRGWQNIKEAQELWDVTEGFWKHWRGSFRELID